MKWLKRLAGAVLVLAAACVGGGMLLSPDFHVERQIEIRAPAAKVYALIEDPRQWASWSAWNQRDPAMVVRYAGSAKGAGAQWSWESASEGSGSMRFTDADPGRRLAYELRFPEFDQASTGELRLESAANTTRVTWSIRGNVGANPLWRWLALFMDDMVGPDFEAGLHNLKTEAEKP